MKWEFKVATVQGDVQSQLNEFGAEGWDLVSASFGYGPSGVHRFDVILKRPLVAGDVADEPVVELVAIAN